MGGGDWIPILNGKRRERNEQELRERNHQIQRDVGTIGKEKKHLSQGSTTIFIDGLDDRTSYEQIKQAFSRVGKIASVFVQRRKKWNRKFKFGFVRYEAKESLGIAIQKLNGMSMNGIPMSVTKARFPLFHNKERKFPSNK